MEESRFKRMVNMLPISIDRLIGSGIAYFISEQEPDDVKMKIHIDDDDNVIGYSIRVKTDKRNVYEAKEFWENNIEPELGGDY